MSIIDTSRKYFDYIPYRLEFIENLLKGKRIEPMIELDRNSCDTEAVQHMDKDIKSTLNKKTFDFNKIINQIGGKLLYIKSGTTGHTFKGLNPKKRENLGVNYAVKIVAYPKKENYGNINDIKRPENAELLMLRVLSYFVVNNQTPHIVLPICTFNANIKPFLSLTRNNIISNKKYDKFISRYKNGEYYETVSVLISEWANGGDLLDYVRKNYRSMKLRHWRVLFFQLISVLCVIQEKYPAFRHNDLKANNILIHKIKSRNKNNKFKYEINNRHYIVPNVGIQIKLWDFDFACIPGIVDNSKVEAKWTDKINVKPEMNRYYDLHYFFNTLTKKGFFPKFFDASEISPKVKNFVKRVVPDKYRTGEFVATRGRILINDEYTTPDKILKTDPFFNKFRPKQDKVTIRKRSSR